MRYQLVMQSPRGSQNVLTSAEAHLWCALLPEPRRNEASPDLRSAALSASIIHSRLHSTRSIESIWRHVVLFKVRG
jgi:hypothetical protein